MINFGGAVPVTVDPTIPRIMPGDINAYVHPTAGSDTTGTGTAGNPFRTIQGAWAKVGGLYLSSPFYAINIILQVPGDYAGAAITGFGSLVRVISNGAFTGTDLNPNGYRIHPKTGPVTSLCLQFFDISMEVVSVTCYMDTGPGPVGIQAGGAASVRLVNAKVQQAINDQNTVFLWSRTGATISGAIIRPTRCRAVPPRHACSYVWRPRVGASRRKALSAICGSTTRTQTSGTMVRFRAA